MLVFQLQIFGLPVTATEYELFQHSHLLERVRCEAVRFGHVQDLLDAACWSVFKPIAAAVAEPREVTFGGEDSHVYILAFAVPGRYFFAGEHERHVASVFVFHRERCDLFAQLLESRHWRVGFFGVVLLCECKIVSVVSAVHKVESDSLGGKLQHFGRGAVFHMVCGVVRVAVHFARGVAGGDRRHLVQDFKAERDGFKSRQVPALKSLCLAVAFYGQLAVRFICTCRDFPKRKRNEFYLFADFDVHVLANDDVRLRRILC